MSEVARRVRSTRQVWAAPGSRHDRLMSVLRVGLPGAIGVLAAFLVMAPLTAGGDVSFVLDKKKVEVAKERLKIQAASYRGQDGKGQPFSLEAGSAVQKSSAVPVVEIDRIAARLGLVDGPATITAPHGQYDMDSEKVRVEGAVAVRAPDGYSLDTQNATVDLKARRLESDSAVTGTVRQGRFRADRMDADLESRVVRLQGNAHLRIVPRETR